MSIRTQGIRLSTLTKELMVHWYETRYFWKDAKSDEFEKKYIEELQMSIDRVVAAIEELDKVLSKITKDCE
jgi:hypothetical protein